MSTLPDPTVEPTISVERAAGLLSVSSRAVYLQCARWRETGGAEGIPSIAIGRSVRVTSFPLLRLLGLVDAVESFDPQHPEPAAALHVVGGDA